MKHALKRRSAQAQTSARVVDGKLILSFPYALTPVVWQMDLSHAKASALQVENDDNNNHFTLILKTPKGETVEIAKFEQREMAVEGLMAASHALENGQGHIRPAASGETAAPVTPIHTGKDSRRRKWTGPALAALFILVLLGIWGALIPRPPSGYEPAGMASAPAPASAQDSSGVPVSADDFLRGR